jgi:hypothetical protein
MNQLQNNQRERKTQHPDGLPITLDRSVPEPVKDILKLNLNLPLPLHNLFEKSFPALFEKEKEVNYGSK